MDRALLHGENRALSSARFVRAIVAWVLIFLFRADAADGPRIGFTSRDFQTQAFHGQTRDMVVETEQFNPRVLLEAFLALHEIWCLGRTTRR